MAVKLACVAVLRDGCWLRWWRQIWIQNLAHLIGLGFEFLQHSCRCDREDAALGNPHASLEWLVDHPVAHFVELSFEVVHSYPTRFD